MHDVENPSTGHILIKVRGFTANLDRSQSVQYVWYVTEIRTTNLSLQRSVFYL